MTANDAASLVATLAFIGILFFVYLLPSVIAVLQKHRNAPAIAVTNVLFGWTFIGWGIALIWSFTQPNK